MRTWLFEDPPYHNHAPCNLLMESVVLTRCYISFHSLNTNVIQDDGCKAICKGLRECKQLQVLT